MRVNRKESNQIGSFEALHSQARDAFSKGQLTETEALCIEAGMIHPDHVGVLNLLGQVYLAQNRSLEAAESFAKAIQTNPRLANIYFNLALAQQAEGDLGPAIQSIRAAIALDPAVPVLHSKLGQLLCMLNLPEEGAAVLRHALTLDGKSAPVRLNLAQALTDLGQVSEAEQITRSALYLHPKDATAHRMLGRIHQINGRFTEASACFEAAISLQPTQAAAYFALAHSKQITPADQLLMARMEELVASHLLNKGDQGLLHYALGKGLDDLGEFDSAMGHFESANKVSLDAMKASHRGFDADLESRKVDRLIQMFPPEVFSKGTSSSPLIERPIFIVGMIRSGTTLVEQILSRHPDVSAGGELRYWIENEPRMHYEWASRSDESPIWEAWRIGYEAQLDRVSISASQITDKMPLNYRALGLIHLAYPNAKIIHCKRNPLDTCLSIYLTPFRRGPEFGHDLETIGAAYHGYLRLMTHWRSIIPSSHLLEVDYEQLVTNLEPRIHEIVEFLELDWDDSCLDANLNNCPANTPSHWQVRQPVYRSSVNRWKNYAKHLEPILHLNSEI